MAGRYTSKVRTFEYMNTPTVVPGDHERRYGLGRTAKGHSDACRSRILTELVTNTEGQRRLLVADERINRSLAEQIEEQDRVPPVQGGR